jgi:membrane associated rhomboid family serine protease
MWHLALNMFTLWMFGSQLELEWGSRRFLRHYLIGGIGAGWIIALFNWLTTPYTVTLGASGAIYAVLTAWSVLWPDRVIMLLFPPIPIKAAYVVPLFLALDFYSNMRVSHIGHIGGALVGLFLVRDQWQRALSMSSLRFRWHRWRMRNRLRAVQRDEWRRRDEDRRGRH